MNDGMEVGEQLSKGQDDIRECFTHEKGNELKREQAEYALNESMKELYEFVDNAPVGVYKTNISGEIIYANKALAQISEFDSVEELLSSNVMDRYKNMEDREELINRIRKTGRIDGFECEMLTKAGKVKNILLSASLSGSIISGMVIDVSKRKRAEELLRKSEERFRSLVKTAASVIIVLSPTGEILEFNPEAERILQKKRVEVLGKVFFELFVDPENRNQVKNEFMKVLLRAPIRGYEVPVNSEDGCKYILSWNINRMLDSRGQIAGMIAIGQDITDRKQVEEELKTLLDISQKIVTTIDLGKLLNVAVKRIIEVTDLDKVVVILKDKLGTGRILAEAVREGEVKTVQDIVWFNDYKIMKEAMGKRKTIYIPDAADPELHGADKNEFLTKHSIRSGIIVPLVVRGEVIGLMIFGAAVGVETFTDKKISFCETIANQLSAMIANAKLLQEAKSTEDALRESEKRYRTIFDDSPISLWEIDCSEIKIRIDSLKKQGITDFRAYFEDHYDSVMELITSVRIVNVNKATLALLGVNDEKIFKSEMQGRFSKFFNKDLYDSFKWLFVSVSNGDTEFESEISIRSISGEEKHISLKCSAAPGYEKTLSKVIMSIIDETERKQMENELLKVQKLESIGVLAGGIAHDFNNLLTSVLGNINLVRIQARPGDHVFERLEEAEKATIRAKDLTQQLLTFSRGGVPIKKTASITDLVKESVRFSLSGSNVKCEYSLAPDIWPVEVDEVQINQVIGNIIINADQAMPDGGTIKVRTENVEVGKRGNLPIKEGKYVKVAIEDQGIGMSWEHIQKVFDPYFTTKQKGSGLGLATVYSIIKRHDGYITAESELGKGTTFFIYLPASDKEIVRTDEKDEEPLPGSGKVLIMDDEEVVREIAGEILAQLGYGVEFASNGNEAIELYVDRKNSGDPFDVVIMDLTVPGYMGGMETIEKLLEVDPDIKSIVSSGYSNDPVMANFSEHGFKEVITKPYTVKELSKVLNRVLSKEN